MLPSDAEPGERAEPHARPGADPAGETGIGGPVLPEGPVERACRRLCALGLLLLILVVAVEVVTRNLMGFSFQVSDELGGYIVVAIAFLSLSVCQVNRSFHHVEFLQARLGRRARILSRILFGLICLAVAAVLTWQLARLCWNAYLSEDVAPTELMTPLWLPQLPMPLGTAALALSLLRTLAADLRALRASRASRAVRAVRASRALRR